MTKLRIVQDTPPLLDLQAGIETARNAISSAREDGEDLIVFPETWLGGYPSWVFGMAKWDCPGSNMSETDSVYRWVTIRDKHSVENHFWA